MNNISKRTAEERNTWFAGLTVEQKRIEIAKDVIVQLEAGKYTTKGGYFSLKGENLMYDQERYKEEFSKITELQTLIDLPEATCQVCGIGAVFASKVRLGDNCKMEHSEHNCDLEDAIDAFVSRDSLVEQLNGIFDPIQCDLIEAAFEGTTTYAESDVSEMTDDEIDDYSDKLAYAERMYRHNTDRDDIMRRIMQNIIDNNGTFVVDRG